MPRLERCLLVRVMLTQRPFARVISKCPTSRFSARVGTTCRSVASKCNRKTLLLLPFAYVCKSTRMGLNEPEGTTVTLFVFQSLLL